MISFSKDDLQYIQKLGLDKEKILADLDRFRKGFPFSRLVRPCRISDGIHVIPPELTESYIALHETAANKGRLMKMVPASGAATRMFAFLQNALLNYPEIRHRNLSPENPETSELIRFIEHLSQFPFYNDLSIVMEKNGLNLETEIQADRYQHIIRYLLFPEGLNFTGLPKALIPFHRYPDHIRTAMEEHLVEAIHTVCDKQQHIRIHFTLSPEHDQAFKTLLNAVLPRYHQNRYQFDITYSYQLSTSHTPAVDENNNPVRDEKGFLIFRPAGHGTLIHNLNDLHGDLVYIKNIDNVAPDRIKETTYFYKKLLAGFLIAVEERIHTYLRELDKPEVSETVVLECYEWLRSVFFMNIEPILHGQKQDMAHRLRTILHRPLRVCGMVKNQGEPGGGPFWVQDQNGNVSCQIVEKHQVNLNDPEQKAIWESSTHFNPVDLVCSLRDHHGQPYDLNQFIDNDTGFISTKFKDGKTVKALEVPGLWNGAMAGWNTLFVEVPLITFNPVKTINDLLRPEHQTEI